KRQLPAEASGETAGTERGATGVAAKSRSATTGEISGERASADDRVDHGASRRKAGVDIIDEASRTKSGGVREAIGSAAAVLPRDGGKSFSGTESKAAIPGRAKSKDLRRVQKRCRHDEPAGSGRGERNSGSHRARRCQARHQHSQPDVYLRGPGRRDGRAYPRMAGSDGQKNSGPGAEGRQPGN